MKEFGVVLCVIALASSLEEFLTHIIRVHCRSNTKTIFEKGVSGKENHTGIGLWEVNQIISKNNNIVLHTSKNDTYFKQQLEIYY